SLGFNLRERLESDHAPLFDTLPNRKGQWLLSRLETHADLRVGEHVQVFTRLQSAFAPGKKTLSPVDQDRIDIEEGFVGITESIDGGTLALRAGRQVFAIDLQRF